MHTRRTRRTTTIIGLFVIAASAASCRALGMATPPDRSKDRVTLTVHAVCTAEAHYKIAGEVTEDDKVTVTLLEANVYRITEWSGSGVSWSLLTATARLPGRRWLVRRSARARPLQQVELPERPSTRQPREQRPHRPEGWTPR